MNLEGCRTLLDQGEWADAVTWKAVLATGAEDAELREKLHHVHVVQWVYLQLWRDQAPAPRALDGFSDLAALRDWVREYYRELPGFLAGVSDADLGREIRIPWADRLVERYGQARTTTLCETLLQVALHGTYHRGQVNRRVRELGGEPPLTDFVAWVWMGRPAPDWS